MKAKTKIVGTSLVVGAVTLAVGGAYIVGSMSDDDSQTLTNSHAKQLVAEQQFKDLEAERFVNTVEQQTELVLTTESGIANLKVSKHSDSWNKWLTRSEAEFGLEYRAKVSIKTQDLIFMNKEGGMVVIFDRDDIEVTSVEITNKNIVLSRGIFGNNYSEEEKFAIEQQMVASIREKILVDSQAMAEAKESLFTYLIETGNTFDLNIEVMCK